FFTALFCFWGGLRSRFYLAECNGLALHLWKTCLSNIKRLFRSKTKIMPLQVKEIGSFHVGGHSKTLTGLPPRSMVLTKGAAPRTFPTDGDFETGQMYAQYVRLVDPQARFPLLLWHGGGMTGVTWETKPDGQPGWQSWFLHAGHDVFVS